MSPCTQTGNVWSVFNVYAILQVVFIVVTRKRKAPRKTDRLVEGLVSQFATSQKEAAAMFITAENKRLKLVMDMEERKQEREMVMREEEREMFMRKEDRKHEVRMMQMMLLMSPGYQSQRYTNTHMNTGMRMNNHADMSNTDGLTHLTMLSTTSNSHSHTHTQESKQQVLQRVLVVSISSFGLPCTLVICGGTIPKLLSGNYFMWQITMYSGLTTRFLVYAYFISFVV